MRPLPMSTLAAFAIAAAASLAPAPCWAGASAQHAQTSEANPKAGLLIAGVDLPLQEVLSMERVDERLPRAAASARVLSCTYHGDLSGARHTAYFWYREVPGWTHSLKAPSRVAQMIGGAATGCSEALDAEGRATAIAPKPLRPSDPVEIPPFETSTAPPAAGRAELERRIAVVCGEQAKLNTAHQKAVRPFLKQLPKSLRSRKGRQAPSLFDVANVRTLEQRLELEPLVVVREAIVGWMNTDVERMLCEDLIGTTRDLGETIPHIVQSATINWAGIPRRAEYVQQVDRFVRSREQRGIPADELKVLQLFSRTAQGGLERGLAIQRFYDRLLVALDQGTPSEYRSRYTAMLDARDKASQARAQERRAIERQRQAGVDDALMAVAGLFVAAAAVDAATIQALSTVPEEELECDDDHRRMGVLCYPMFEEPPCSPLNITCASSDVPVFARRRKR